MNKLDKYKVMPVLKIFLYMLLAILGIVFLFKTKGVSVLLLLLLLLIPKEREKLEIISYGMKGEKVTTKVLEKLPRKYKILNDKKVTKPSGYNQLDHIVIGPNGVFIVETKYHKGTISGSDEDVQVLQQKTTDSGKKYSARFLNPTKQVQTHVRTLKRKLKTIGYEQVSVVGLVYFSHPDTNVNLKSSENKIFASKKSGASKMRRYIKKYRGNYRLNPKEIRSIVSSI